VDRQCASCGGFCKKSGCERENVKPEQEPVGRFAKFSNGIWKEVTDGSAGQPLYTVSPQREWQGLTDEEAKKTFEAHNCVISADLAGILARAIEAKLKEKNT
jgi:hypothetical protein